ncbi:unnamed protein product [Discula destructiva]
MATIQGLNTQTGVYPFAYPPRQRLQPRVQGYEAVQGVPDTEAQPLAEFTYDHLMQFAEWHVQFDINAQYPTPFTSWTADFTTALWFASGSYAQRKTHVNVLGQALGYVCILDTAAWIPDGQRGRRIIHAPELGWTSLPFEYFVHGPVHGEAFRCVQIADIQRVLDCSRFPFCPTPYGAPPAPAPAPAPTPAQGPTSSPFDADLPEQFRHLLATGTPAGQSPPQAPRGPETTAALHIPTRDEVAYAVRVGALFQLPDDGDIDVTLAVAAFMLARTQFNITPGSATPVEERWLRANLFVTGPERPIDMFVDRDTAQAIGDHMFPMSIPLPPISALATINTNLDTLAQPQLQWAKNLLLRLDMFWRSLASAPRAWTGFAWREAVSRLEGAPHRCPSEPMAGQTTSSDGRGATVMQFTTPPRLQDPALLQYSRSPSTPGSPTPRSSRMSG